VPAEIVLLHGWAVSAVQAQARRSQKKKVVRKKRRSEANNWDGRENSVDLAGRKDAAVWKGGTKSGQRDWKTGEGNALTGYGPAQERHNLPPAPHDSSIDSLGPQNTTFSPRTTEKTTGVPPESVCAFDQAGAPPSIAQYVGGERMGFKVGRM
jgi:hypothetical protein